MTVKEIKKQMRSELLKLSIQLDPVYTRQADRQIRGHLLSLPEYKSAGTIFCFVGTAGEINTSPFLAQALADGKRVAVPLCTGRRTMQARQIRSLDDLHPGFSGIPEPDRNAPVIEPDQIDLAVIPCVSCSHDGSRLGHGGGYYDVYFNTRQKMHTVLICREAMVRNNIPEEPHDRTFRTVITETGIRRN